MKHTYFNLFTILLFLWVISSCKKEAAKTGPGVASLTIVNSVVGNNSLLTNFNGDKLGVPYYRLLTPVIFGSVLYSNSYSGTQKLNLFSASDTSANSKPLYNLTLNLPVNSSHTLFLMGTPQLLDTLFTTDQLPHHAPADSVMGIRFVNIAKGNAPVSVNLIGEASGSTVENLPYKGVTGFKNYPVNSSISSYTFEFRDKATGELLVSRKLDGIDVVGGSVDGNGQQGVPNNWRNNNFTLALFGSPGLYYIITFNKITY